MKLPMHTKNHSFSSHSDGQLNQLKMKWSLPIYFPLDLKEGNRLESNGIDSVLESFLKVAVFKTIFREDKRFHGIKIYGLKVSQGIVSFTN